MNISATQLGGLVLSDCEATKSLFIGSDYLIPSIKALLVIFLLLCVPFLFLSMIDLTFWDSLFSRKTDATSSALELDGEFSHVFPQKQFPALFLIITVFVFLLAYYNTSQFIFLILPLLTILYHVIKAKLKPFSPVVIRQDSISVYGQVINWDEIQKIEFTVANETYITPKGLSSTMARWAIVILLSDYREIKIYMASYQRNRDMRSVIQQIAIKKGINVRVYDKGL